MECRLSTHEESVVSIVQLPHYISAKVLAALAQGLLFMTMPKQPKTLINLPLHTVVNAVRRLHQRMRKLDETDTENPDEPAVPVEKIDLSIEESESNKDE
jgi:hypothetical protein